MGRRGTLALGPLRRDASAPLEDARVRTIDAGALDAVRRAVAVVAFRPVHADELHRVLAPGGSLIVAATDVDEPDAGLRASAVPTWELADSLWSRFEHDQTRDVDGAGAPVAVIRLRRRRRAA